MLSRVSLNLRCARLSLVGLHGWRFTEWTHAAIAGTHPSHGVSWWCCMRWARAGYCSRSRWPRSRSRRCNWCSCGCRHRWLQHAVRCRASRVRPHRPSAANLQRRQPMRHRRCRRRGFNPLTNIASHCDWRLLPWAMSRASSAMCWRIADRFSGRRRSASRCANRLRPRRWCAALRRPCSGRPGIRTIPAAACPRRLRPSAGAAPSASATCWPMRCANAIVIAAVSRVNPSACPADAEDGRPVARLPSLACGSELFLRCACALSAA